MNRIIFKKLSYAVLCIFLIFSMSACDNGEDSPMLSQSSGNESAGTGSISFRIADPDAQADQENFAEQSGFRRMAELLFLPATAIAGFSEHCDDLSVETFVYYASDLQNPIAKGGPWACYEHKGVISGMPAGANEMVIVVLMTSGENALYRGEISKEIVIITGETADAGTIQVDSFVPVLKSDVSSIRWDDITGATAYEIQKDDTVIDSIGEDAVQHLYFIEENRKYQVRALDVHGHTGAWSEMNISWLQVKENSPGGTEVGNISEYEEDLTYGMIGGSGSGLFDVDINSGQVTVAENSVLNYEKNSEYDLEIQTESPEGLQKELVLKIQVLDVNDSPDVGNQYFNIKENSPEGTPVGKIDAADEDENDLLSFTVTGGTGKDIFDVDSEDGQISVVRQEELNYEEAPEYTLSIEVQDDGEPSLSKSAEITIGLEGDEEAPEMAAQKFDIAENSPPGTSLGIISAMDAEDDRLTFQVGGGTGENLFEVNSETGEIILAPNAVMNYEGESEYTLEVQVQDDSEYNLKTQALMSIAVQNKNDVPQIESGQRFSIEENSQGSIKLGKIVATDEDGNNLSYEIVGGTGMGLFEINSETGEITLAPGAEVNYEAAPEYTLDILVKDDGEDYQAKEGKITIAVEDQNDRPLILDPKIFEISEDSDAGKAGRINVTDDDADEVLVYEILSTEPDGEVFYIDENGDIVLNPGVLPDHEIIPQYRLDIKVTDRGGLSDQAVITVLISDVNEYPEVTHQDISIDEHLSPDMPVGKVIAEDQDEGDVLTYKVVGGSGEKVFPVDENTGDISVAPDANLNFEEISEYNLTVEVRDSGGLAEVSDISIQLNDLNDLPVMEEQTFQIMENSSAGTEVGEVKATDEDTEDLLTYRLVGGSGIELFEMNPEDGRISTNAVLNYEEVPEYTLDVEVTDGKASSPEKTMTVKVENTNDPPTMEAQTFEIMENIYSGTVVGQIIAADEDADDILTYEVMGGTGESLFNVDKLTGVISIAESGETNYESASEYTLDVQVRDDGVGNLRTQETMKILLRNVNEPPIANAGDDQSVTGTSPSTSVQLDGSASMDPENSSLTYDWSVEEGEYASLSDPSAVNPVLTLSTLSGESVYTIKLVTSDGVYESDADFVTVTVTTSIPEDYAGMYNGTYSYSDGSEAGSLSLSVYADENISGAAYNESESIELSGTVSEFTGKDSSGDLVFMGSIDSTTGKMTGSWFYQDDFMGTFEAQREE